MRASVCSPTPIESNESSDVIGTLRLVRITFFFPCAMMTSVAMKSNQNSFSRFLPCERSQSLLCLKMRTAIPGKRFAQLLTRVETSRLLVSRSSLTTNETTSLDSWIENPIKGLDSHHQIISQINEDATNDPTKRNFTSTCHFFHRLLVLYPSRSKTK